MKKIIVLLCLGLMGCAAIPGENRISHRGAGKAGCRAAAEADQKDVDNIIVMFSEAIKKNPDYAGAYYNRGMAYFYKHDYDKSLHDILKAEALGITVDQDFIKLIEKLNKVAAKKNNYPPLK